MRRTVEFKPDTRNVFLHILTRCNLKCRHCYINQDEHGADILDADTIKEWLGLFVYKPGRPQSALNHINWADKTNLIFLGGEPTLNQALPLAIKEAKRLGYGSITVDTNGFLFYDILDKIGPDELNYLSFSLDGSCPEVNDPIRGSGVFKICTAGIRKAVSRGFNVSVIFTASRMNLYDLANMPGLLKRLGVKRFFIQVIGIRGRSSEVDSRTVSLQFERNEWEQVMPRVAVAAAKMGIHVTYPKVFLGPDEPFICAGVAAMNYFVFPNGRVYRCPLCEDYPVHSFEIKGGHLLERPPLTERELFQLTIPEGCVFNRILHPGNIQYDEKGRPVSRIACCMLKEEVLPEGFAD
ncbi:MAG: radical SAM protein [Dissulfurimicrobium sp.]|nr:radical SAM protein [Dissulfurimicrobium hydrothermale]UKL14445.1 radical SAM protein [Dissulfurimicrobium hydrothermale]